MAALASIDMCKQLHVGSQSLQSTFYEFGFTKCLTFRYTMKTTAQQLASDGLL